MKQMIFSALVLLGLSMAAHAEVSEEQLLRDGYLAGCWAESGAGTVDGTFLLRFKMAPIPAKATGKALREALALRAREMGEAEDAILQSAPHLVLLGTATFYWEPRAGYVSYVVQADFNSPGLRSRQELKELVARDLLGLKKLPQLNALEIGEPHISCYRRSPFKSPSVTGSN